MGLETWEQKYPRDWIQNNTVNPFVGSSGNSVGYFYSASDVASLLADSLLNSNAEFPPLGRSPKNAHEMTWFKHFGSRVTGGHLLSNFALEFEKRAAISLDSQYCAFLDPKNEERSLALKESTMSLFEFSQRGYEDPARFKVILNTHRGEFQSFFKSNCKCIRRRPYSY